MKSSAQRVVGIVMGMLLGVVIQCRAQERTAFVCEGRIGNAATSPDAALRGDFEYDIGTNTAAPQQLGQFQWESGYPFNFTIQYAPGPAPRQAMFTLGSTITSTVPAEVFADTHALGNLNLRVASLHPGSGVWLGNLELTTVAGITNLPAMVTSNQNQKLDFLTGQPLAAGFSVTGTAVFWWQAPNIPGRSHLQFQISASEWKVDLDVDTDRNGTVDDAADEAGEDQWGGIGGRRHGVGGR
jgi:hypothetical protein